MEAKVFLYRKENLKQESIIKNITLESIWTLLISYDCINVLWAANVTLICKLYSFFFNKTHTHLENITITCGPISSVPTLTIASKLKLQETIMINSSKVAKETHDTLKCST